MMDSSFSHIIQQVNLIDSSLLKDEIKLRRAGELFYQSSISLLAQADAALEEAKQQDIDLIDTPINNSFGQFLTSLTQQSISTAFLQKYLHPQNRAKYKRGASVKIQTLTSASAVDLFDLDLFESEVISLAHDEDIDACDREVTKCLESNTEISTLPQISRTTSLSIAQAFISLLFGDFELAQSGDFYDPERISVATRQH